MHECQSAVYQVGVEDVWAQETQTFPAAGDKCPLGCEAKNGQEKRLYKAILLRKKKIDGSGWGRGVKIRPSAEKHRAHTHACRVNKRVVVDHRHTFTQHV